MKDNVADSVGMVVNMVATGVGRRGLDSLVDQIGHSVAKGSPSLRRFFGAV